MTFAQELRNKLAETGFEYTPEQVQAGLDEACERIRSGPDGLCIKCGQSHREDGESLDFRFGLCDECAFTD